MTIDGFDRRAKLTDVRAIVFDTVGGPLALREVPEPVCPDDGVLIQVKATGVCRSDWHGWAGHDPVPLPHIPGHELAGVIAQVGPLIVNFKAGDRVTVPFVCGCGACEVCLSGNAQVCPHQTQPGFTHDGSFADLVAIYGADYNLVELPPEIDFVTAAGLGCRFATAFRALTAHGQVQPGDQVAVHGCGGVGLSAVMIALALGASVIAIDISDSALAAAAELGARVLNSGDLAGPAAVGERVQELTGGVQISVDALGLADTAVASVLSLRRRGRHVQVGLLLGERSTPPLPMDRVLSWELSLHGSHGMAAHEYPAMLSLIASGILDPSKLIGRVISLDEAGESLESMSRPATAPGLTVVRI